VTTDSRGEPGPVEAPRSSASGSEETATGAEDVPDDSPDKKHLRLWQELLLLLAIALVLAVVIKALFLQAFYIPSVSMEPGLIENDRILVQKVSYWGDGSPERGDVVVFEDPGGWLDASESAGPTNPVARLMVKVGLYPQGGHLVKRVIGVENDVITCCDDQGRVMVNGHPLDEGDYVKDSDQVECHGPRGPGDCQWTADPVPTGHIFVMGDNRANSGDSSAHMCAADQPDCADSPYVPVNLVVGKVFVLLWPADRFGFLHPAETFADTPDA
jgi:signal peptidase I